MKKYLVFVNIIVLFALMATPILAESKLDPLPEPATLDINDFVGQSKLVTQEFENDASLNFQMQIPKSFIIRDQDKLKNIEKDGKIYGPIFTALGSSVGDTTRPYISVQAIELDRLISAKNWIITKSLEWGYTLRGIEEEDPEGNAFDAFYIRLDSSGNTEIVRARGFLHDTRLILVEFVLPVPLWEQGRDTQIFSIKSFEFLETFAISSPEEMNNFSYLDSFYLEYPTSWRLNRRDLGSVNTIDVNLKTTDSNNFMLAETDITVVSSKSLRDRADQMVYPFNLPKIIKDRMKVVNDMGFDIDPIMEQHDYKLSFTPEFQTTEVYPLRKKQSSVYVTDATSDVSREFWLTVLKRPEEEGKNYIITMIAPSRTVNLYQWAIAVKAYEHMITSIR
tara:strand:- start:489 stop:1667 length:1179 start_codon:yes stop_codon:yes gene_type:complete